ncbi:MAG: Fructosamine-3-kinase [Verrucomicrobia bacterium]|jgi:fructosamine-3-kinase|nr:MAG: Fructosamine-3-kinase [Verrucomicrobiota bacterium]
MESLDQRLIAQLLEVTGHDLGPARRRPVSGGCIHRCWILEGRWGECFVKANTAGHLAMFEAEREALRALAEVRAIRVPEPYLTSRIGNESFLLMERIEFGGAGSGERQGRELAALHQRVSGDGRCGWDRDNFIGSTPQPNRWNSHWGDFFAEHRIEHQLRLNRDAGNVFRGARRFVERVPALAGDHAPGASLLHGDLWGGNAGFDLAGRPVIFDPASYHGDRETDLAFTRLFGGFGESFERGYHEAWPLPDGWRDRVELYNLYHLLNHALLFGGGYGEQAQRIMDRFV